MNTDISGKRIEYLDIAKGLVMFIVVYHHTSLVPKAIAVLYHPFFMSFFFIVSGYFYKYRDTKTYFKGKSYSLLLPYVIWRSVYSLIELALSIIKKEVTRGALIKWLKDYAYGILALKSPSMSGPTWFFICLFVVSTIYYIIDKYSKNYRIKTASVFLIALVGILLNEFTSVLYPFKLVNAMIELPIFFIGNALKRYEFMEKKIQNGWRLYSIVIIYLLLSVLHYNICGTTVSVTNNQYHIYPLFYVNAILGSIIIVSLGSYINRVSLHLEKENKIVKLIENSSIYSGMILCVHNPLDGILKILFSHFPYFQGLAYEYAIIISIIVYVGLTLFAVYILKEKYRFLFGIKKSKATS